ncbi:DUF4232 domain-containing protein [Actinoalloteichus spitiensis]|uniref:DUF4232 domain-containing protein n=1 Tax=Actinoalloteichus spitiensis TaxID=252394 RepID=UPI0005848B70|nr:DUF4232 domain-containing protein [Actinoalloteichus spitiensis]
MRPSRSLLVRVALPLAAVLGFAAACGGAPTGGENDQAQPPPPTTTTSEPARTGTGAPGSTESEAAPSESDLPGGPPPSPERSDATESAVAEERCHTSELRAEVRPLNAAAGNRYADLVLTNTSGRTCSIYGYGGMELVDENGRAIATDLRRTNDPGPQLVQLAPNASAAKKLHWTVVPGEGDPEEEPCGPEPVSINVIPPDETDPLSASWTLGPVCDGGRIEGSAYFSM